MGTRQALLTLVVAWPFAAFGEESGYRGYLLTRIADLGNRSTVACRIAHGMNDTYVVVVYMGWAT